MRTLLRHCLLLSAVPLVVACASSGSSSGTSTSGGPRENADRLVLAENDARLQAGGSLLDLIRRERPQWLTRRASSIGAGGQNDIVVYRDGVRIGGPEVLREIPINVVATATWLDGPEAAARFGLNHQYGAILVVTRK